MKRPGKTPELQVPKGQPDRADGSDPSDESLMIKLSLSHGPTH